MRFAIVREETNQVVNVIEWEGDKWFPPQGCLVVRSDIVDVGDTYVPEKKTFIKAKS